MWINVWMGDRCFNFFAQSLSEPYSTTTFQLVSTDFKIPGNTYHFEVNQLLPAEVEKFYSAIGTAVKEDPQFQLDHFVKVGPAPGNKFLMTLKLDAKNIHQLKANIYEVRYTDTTDRFWKPEFTDSKIALRGSVLPPPGLKVPSEQHVFSDTTAKKHLTKPSLPPSRPLHTKVNEKERFQQCCATLKEKINLTESEFANLLLGNAIFSKITAGSYQLPADLEITRLVRLCHYQFKRLYSNYFIKCIEQGRAGFSDQEEYQRVKELMVLTRNFFTTIQIIDKIDTDKNELNQPIRFANLLEAKLDSLEEYTANSLQLSVGGMFLVGFCVIIGLIIGSVIGTVVGFCIGAAIGGTLGSVPMPGVGTMVGGGIGGVLMATKVAIAAGGVGALVGAVIGKLSVSTLGGWGMKSVGHSFFFKNVDTDPLNHLIMDVSQSVRSVFDVVREKLIELRSIHQAEQQSARTPSLALG